MFNSVTNYPNSQILSLEQERSIDRIRRRASWGAVCMWGADNSYSRHKDWICEMGLIISRCIYVTVWKTAKWGCSELIASIGSKIIIMVLYRKDPNIWLNWQWKIRVSKEKEANWRCHLGSGIFALRKQWIDNWLDKMSGLRPILI